MFIAAVGGCVSPSTTFENRERLKIHAENAQRYYGAGRYDAAVQQAKKALGFDSNDPKALTILGYCYLQVARRAKDPQDRLRYFEMTEEKFEHAIESGRERDPAVFKSYFGLGLAYFMWSREVKRLLEESCGKKSKGVVPGRDTQEEIWSE
jgi:tetratricopeptide (TPR) repeat protein